MKATPGLGLVEITALDSGYQGWRQWGL